MRICHVSPHLPPDQAANALLPAELGRWAHARGHAVTFLAQAPRQGGTQTVGLPGRVRHLSNVRSASSVSRALRIDTFRRARLISAALDDLAKDADLLHLHSNGLIVEVAAAWARRHRVPFVLTLYGTEIWHYRRRWPIDPFRRAYLSANAVTFYSQRLQEKAEASGLTRSGLSVVYPAVSPMFASEDDVTRAAWRQELGIEEPLVVLNVKRLHELAGQRFLVDAFAQVTRGRSDIRLVICGTGPLRPELEDRARAVGIAGKVTFTGLVPNPTVARYAGLADVFALPSLLEALPTVAVEALAAGTPVVSANHPGGEELHELFGEDVALVPKSDADALAEALTATLSPPRRVTASTSRLVRERFSPAAVESAYQAVYDRALGTR